ICPQLVDSATALALRQTTQAPAVRDKRRRRRGEPAPDLSCPPTIRTMPFESIESSTRRPASSLSVVVPVVIVPPIASVRTALPPVQTPATNTAPPSSRASFLKLDLSWITAVFVAISVTLALAIPLELLRQSG